MTINKINKANDGRSKIIEMYLILLFDLAFQFFNIHINDIKAVSTLIKRTVITKNAFAFKLSLEINPKILESIVLRI